MPRSTTFCCGLLMMLALVVGGCGLFNSGPSATVKKFYSLVEKGQLNGATELIEASPSVQGMLSMALSSLTEEIRAKGGIRSIDITSEETTGETSVVKFTITFGNGTTKNDSEHLVRKDGKWKVVASK